MSKSNSDKKGKGIWSVINIQQLTAAIASLGDRVNQLKRETWRLNAETKLPTSLWGQVLENLGINGTERRRQSLYKIWQLKRHNIDKRVESELKRKNKNTIDGNNDDISQIEELSVQEDNKSHLPPDPSLPLPKPPNTRGNEAKTVNGNIIERSIVSETSFILTPSEWKNAFSSSQKKLNDGWTKIFSEKLESCGITCSVSFYRAHVKGGKRKRRCQYFWCRAKCTGMYCTRSYLIKLKEPADFNTSPIFRVHISGTERHDAKIAIMSRQLCGEERYRVGK
jgi:hypothetical protein